MLTVINQIVSVVPTMPGWCSVNKALHLAGLVFSIRPELSVEIGVFGGRSLVPLALAHQRIGGKVIGIDPWDSAACVVGQTEANVQWWENQERITQAEVFCRKTLDTLGLSPYVELIKATSDSVDVPKGIGVLHIDGNHSEQAVKDVQRYAPQIVQGGFLVLDDLDWDNQGPVHAFALAQTMQFKVVCTVSSNYQDSDAKDCYAVLQRV